MDRKKASAKARTQFCFGDILLWTALENENLYRAEIDTSMYGPNDSAMMLQLLLTSMRLISLFFCPHSCFFLTHLTGRSNGALRLDLKRAELDGWSWKINCRSLGYCLTSDVQVGAQCSSGACFVLSSPPLSFYEKLDSYFRLKAMTDAVKLPSIIAFHSVLNVQDRNLQTFRLS